MKNSNCLRLLNRCFCLLALLFVAPTLTAQAPPGTNSPVAARRQPSVSDSVKSPEILPDHRVTFRIYAPKAAEVGISGDWIAQGRGTGGKLEKDEKGIWSITLGPLIPDIYSYSFSVDGVKVVDPKNAMIKQGLTSLDSTFFMSGDESAFEENKLVAHGDVREAWYQSGTLGAQRRLHIYTPPGYDGASGRYPVFYLLHGAGDEDSGWNTIGRAGFIMDNLLAAKKAKPMIIVMPNGSIPRPASLPATTPGAGPSPEAVAFQERFTNELLNDVIPFVEQHYRALTNPESRALAGLSMGGGQTLRVLTHNPEKFAYVGIWSAGMGPNAADFEKRNSTFFENSDKVNQTVKLLSISVGDKDTGALTGSKSLVELLNKHAIKNEFHVSEGGHTWINWRRYLNDFAPLLFQ